ncbi:MAG: hypothetical protein ACI841_003219 [Planctomycetota bacterium]|jgi:hypothetical protein
MMSLLAALDFVGYQWSRSWGFGALLLPLVLLWLSRRPVSPAPEATGTFSLWAESRGVAEGHRQRRRLPLSRWLLLFSLAVGAIALAGPRPISEPDVLRWRLWLDRSPSMYLPWVREAAEGKEGSIRRIDRVLHELDVWRNTKDDSGFVIEWEWVTRTASGWERHLGPSAPPEWLEAPIPALDEMELPPGDSMPGIVLTDQPRADLLDESVGFFACGGDAVAGLIASGADFDLEWDAEWDGAGTRKRSRSPQCVRFDAQLPPPLVEFIQVWADDRQLTCVVSAGERGQHEEGAWVALEIIGGGAGASSKATVERDGWRMTGQARAVAAASIDCRGQERFLHPWPSGGLDERAQPYVARAAGLLSIGWTEVAQVAGEPVSFAVAWGALLDEALVERPEIVSIAERAAAGDAVSDPPPTLAAGIRMSEDVPPLLPLEVWITIAAAGLAFASRMLRGS